MGISDTNHKRYTTFFPVFGLIVILLFNAQICFAAGISVIPDSSVVIQVINFLLLIWAMNILVYKPIRGILAQRKEKVGGLEQRIGKLGNDAREKDEAYGSGIKAARATGLKQKQALVEAAAAEEKKLIEDINRRAQANLAEMKDKIAKDVDVVKASLEKEVDSFAEAIGRKILGRAI